ncbi:hypothetical protein [Labrys wisconsinensis]|uniref:Uncharacterized protein n=1 Tax=Labrys wisconsinensis TaxID=425677 RepID=A0ABU0J216_9HYPH|nr:hypothetical protein [Labrys wisconsinensis]MDQ0468296.1 hypothetical protein [Labrys wisconsinensis]
MTPDRPARRLARLALLPLKILVAALILIDEVVRPLYRPLARWISSLRLMAAMEAAIAGLPRYAVLLLLAVPFAIAEPMKLLGLIWLGRGLFVPGIVVTVLGHLISFILVERIYQAGRDKLLTFAWFAWLIGLITRVRDAMTAWAKATAFWTFVQRMRAATTAWLKTWRTLE